MSRAAACLDDERWWHVPSALQASAWSIIPGSGPAGVDPWTAADEAADKGDASGVRVARALQILVAANSGHTDIVERALKAHATSLSTVPQDPDWALLDEYARLVSLHQSDILWTDATGHRTETFGALPGDQTEAAPPPDPFGE